MLGGDKPRLLLDSVLLGIIGGLSARLFMWMLHLSQHFFLTWIAGYRPPGLPEEGGVLRQMIGPHGLWLVPVATTLGGLISGALVYGLAPETEGHGTDTVVRAVHWTGSVLRARVAPVKMVASAITIGSGGSAGREGPTALIAAGFGSVYASLLHRPERAALIGLDGHGRRAIRYLPLADRHRHFRRGSFVRWDGLRIRRSHLLHACCDRGLCPQRMVCGLAAAVSCSYPLVGDGIGRLWMVRFVGCRKRHHRHNSS